jgi:hypothetical protein
MAETWDLKIRPPPEMNASHPAHVPPLTELLQPDAMSSHPYPILISKQNTPAPGRRSGLEETNACDQTFFMRFTPALALLTSCLLIGTTSLTYATDKARKATPYTQVCTLVESLRAQKLATPAVFGETEYDLLEAMVSGVVPVDPSFCERIKLIEITDGLLPLLERPIPGVDYGVPDTFFGAELNAIRLFSLRSQLLCQQGKVAEGQAWMMKIRLMARRPHGDHTLIQHLTTIAMELVGQQTAARYAEIWPESDRLTYIRSAESLPALPDIDMVMRQEDDHLPEKIRVSSLITKFKSMNPEEQIAYIRQVVDASSERPDVVRRSRELIINLTPTTWNTLRDSIADELKPLTIAKHQAFAARNAAALKSVEAEEARTAVPTSSAVPSAEKAEAIYRVILGPGVESIARSRLDMELKSRLLTLVMQKGAAFDESCLAGLKAANGSALRLGTHEGNKAVFSTASHPFLIIGPAK